jgi:2-haloacid dehalogenase
MNGKPQNIVFDIGNVLIGWDPMVLYRRLFEGDEEKSRWFLENVCTSAWNIEQDRGRSFKDAVALLSAAHPGWASHIAAYDTHWLETITGPIDGTVDILKELHGAGVPVYAITNWNDEKFALARGRFAFLNLFRDIVVSATERVIKPDPEIYAILCRRNGLQAADCVFIDDSEKNVHGARQAGMAGIHFVGAGDLRRRLSELGHL